jgi:hypothetical protein
MVRLRLTGASNGVHHAEITGLPGAPKELNLKKRAAPHPFHARKGSQMSTFRDAVPGDAIWVMTMDEARLRIRVSTVRPDGAMVGTVEIVETAKPLQPTEGVQHRDSVIVRNAAEFVEGIDER